MNRLFRSGRILLLLALALALSVPTAAVAQLSEHTDLQGESPTFGAPVDTEAVPEQIIVKFEENVSPTTKADVRRAEGLEKEKDLKLIGAEVDKVKGRSVDDAIRDLNGHPEVEYAERDYIVHATDYANEPRFGELWGLNNTGQIGGVPNADINGLEASGVTQGDPNLVVAVIDTGVDFSHTDLSGRRWVNPGESGGGKETNGIDDDGNGFVDDVNGADFFSNDGNPFDDNGHGTHLAGTIAASVNDQGVVGVAPNVKIMGLKFLGASGSGSTSNAVRAIGYAQSKGIKISNNSWGCQGHGCFSQALKDAIDTSGSLFVAAAGNNDINNDVDPSYPASYDSQNILSVAAVDRFGNKAWFSNFGANSVDISAPGVEILSSVPGNTYASLDGTSMAAPHAAGVAALAASGDPALLSDPVALKNHIMDTGKPVPAMAGITVTGDMVDAEAAVGGGSAPANDNFAQAQMISGSVASLDGTTKRATRETNEPDHYTSNPNDADLWLGDHTVWYSWKAPASGSTTIDTCQADIDSILAVYTGSAFGSLSRVADNNNDFCGGGWGSKVTFNATAGATYRIAVGDAGGLRENTFTLKLSAPRDTQAPKVSSTSPVSNATGVGPGANITATFSEAMMPSSINPSTVKLFRAGTTTAITAAVSYEPTTKKATLNPDANLRLGAKYKAVVTTGAKDLAGNRLDQNSSQSGLQQKSWTFTIRN